MKVEWDAAKERQNVRRHGLAFSEVGAVVADPDCLEIFDVEHSHDEERFISIGPIVRGIVVVVWTERFQNVVRIISARFATKREKRLYLEFMEERE